MRIRNILFAAIPLLAGLDPAVAEVRLTGIFADHMVLQRDAAVRVWGWADAGREVTVRIAAQTKVTTADPQGRWAVQLDPLGAGGPLTLTAKCGDAITLHDVLVGEVWLCSGDANMVLPISRLPRGGARVGVEMAANVRWFGAAKVAATGPREDVAGAWSVCDRETIGNFPALAFYFASELSNRLGVAVGIVEAAHDLPLQVERGGRVTGTPIEAFISPSTLRTEAAAAGILEYYDSGLDLRDAVRAYVEDLAGWKRRHSGAFGDALRALETREPDVWYDYVEEMRKAGKSAPPAPPRKPTRESLRNDPTRPGNLYNRMIATLASFAIRGIVWVQGAANAPRAAQYRGLLPALVRDWRRAWGVEDLPFVYLQQPRIFAGAPGMDPRPWSELREAQAMAQSISGTAMAPSLDLPAGRSLTHDDVRTLGARLALAARGVAYGERVRWSGPAVESVRFEQGKAIVKFRRIGGGLATRGAAPVKGFALAERPDRWVYARARIEGNDVIASHPDLAAPIALRYDWVVEPGEEGNIIDEDGLPAPPFRSDDWPAFTETQAATVPHASAPINRVDLYPVADPTLPRVLLLGDSITNGYSGTVVAALRGKANVNVQITGAGPATVAQQVDTTWHIDRGDYAVIHFNNGLHSMPPRETDEQFEANLRELIRKLTLTRARLVWATITPAPDRNNLLSAESWNPSVIARNEISKRIAAETGIGVNDLYTLVIHRREELQGFGDLHFKPEGSKLMGEQVAAMILEAIGDESRRASRPKR